MKFALQLGRFNFSVGFGGKAAGSGSRNYSAGAINRLTADWETRTTSPDVEARNDVVKVRARARELERNDPYARRYFKLLRNNVLGHKGIRLAMKIKEPDGTLDDRANKQIESAWKKWCKRRNCTVQKTLSWRMVCQQVLTAPPRDGGVLVRKVEGFQNEFAFALQVLEIDHLDVYYNVPNTAGGNEIRMGVEFNDWREPIAYHLWTRHPGDYNAATSFNRVRVPAKEIIHLYLPERVLQSVGVPWITAAMLRLNMLRGYDEAELVAARAGACKGGYIEKEAPEEFQGDGEDENGNKVEEMEPGTVRELDPGQHFVEHDPKHPTQAYAPYTKQVLRGAASGMSVSYNSLANDLEGVNYSSIRAGLLEDREEYMMVQEWLIEDFCDEVFEAWLPLAMLSGQVNLPMAKLEKFLAQTWQARRWPWVDPLKDIQATVMAIGNRLESRTGALADQGTDIEELYEEIAEEEELAEEKGIEVPPVQTGAEAEPVKDEPGYKPGTGAAEDPEEEAAATPKKKTGKKAKGK